MLQIKKFTFNPVQENTFVVYSTKPANAPLSMQAAISKMNEKNSISIFLKNN